MNTDSPVSSPSSRRHIFCNRTVNLRAIKVIGYDMDYTLIHYHVAQWEQRAYDYIKQHFAQRGWPVEGLNFDPNLVSRGLIIDTQTGNVVKTNRFGFVRQAFHGTKAITFENMRKLYARTIVDLADRRWEFLNTLFSLSEGCMYAQLVDLLEQKKLPEVMGHAELYRQVREAINRAHVEGSLKADIMANPDKFVDKDPDLLLTLLDQKHAGKKLMLITNSEWFYTQAMMRYLLDEFMPAGQTWRDIFDIVIVGARKPDFFATNNPLFEIVSPEGHLLPSVSGLKIGAAFLGGSARQVESILKVSGDEILYVGDHMYSDVRVTKEILRWRTALVIRELEDEVDAVEAFSHKEQRLKELMGQKEVLEHKLSGVRLHQQRVSAGYGPKAQQSSEELKVQSSGLKDQLRGLDQEIAALAEAASRLRQDEWGLLMRAGNDKSHLAFQTERYADLYTSRVSNFLQVTPFAYLRSIRGSMPHDLASNR